MKSLAENHAWANNKSDAENGRDEMKSTAAVPPRFKPRLRQIQELRISNRSFQELWEEYSELLEALKPVEGGMKTLTRLKSELEKEIEEALDDKYRD